MSNVYTLATLNILRTKAGMKPLKAWKESKAKLEAACAKLARVKDVTDLPPNKELAKAKPVAKPAAKKEKVEGVSISTIAAEVGIDPKVARAKLRRAFGDADGTGSNGRWVFTDKKVAEIKAILKGDARKKA